MVAVLATCAAAALGLAVIAAWWLHGYVVQWQARAAVERALASLQPRAAPPDADLRVVPPPIDRNRAGASLRGNPAEFFSAEAYPADAMRANRQGRTVARLTVDAAGVPVGCTIVTSSGSRSLDAATCSIAIGKVRYDPARDAAGRPIASTATLPVRWVLPRE